MLEKPLINPIHLGKMIHRRQKYIDLDDLLERGTCGGEDSRQVVDAELCHLGDGVGFEGQDLARWCAGYLARAVDCGGGRYCLGLRVLARFERD